METNDVESLNRSRNPINRESFRKLKTRNKRLEMRIQQLKEDLMALREENMALRESNVKFQVDNYKLQKSIKKCQLKNKFYQVFQNKVFSRREDPEMQDEDSDCFENDVFEIIEDMPENQFDSDENDTFDHEEVNASYRNNNSNHADELDETYEDNLEEDEKDLPVPMEIPEKLDDNANADTTIKFDRNQIPLPNNNSNNKIPISRSHFKNLCHQLENLKEGKKYDALFVCKLMDVLFDRDTLIGCNNAARNSDYKHKGISLLDPVKVKLMKKMLLDRIESEDIDDQEKRERIKKFYNYVNMKIFNSTKKKPFFRRSVSESGYL